ncbi:DUF6086 family protein [Streptomyces sp. NPDC049577]|uniref:DUF6086 family protein n=1 Tax=Streptomyces sp. NPDC049577 TaxID=3155153 RepID=UPI00342FF77E
MSQYFQIGDEILWNPSSGVSRIFLRQVAVFEAELGLPSGIGPMEADECQIDPAVFGAFADALLAAHRRTHHAVLLALSEGFVITVLALAERAGVRLCWVPPRSGPGGELRDVPVPAHPVAAGGTDAEWADRLRRDVRALDRFMVR